MLYQIEGSSTRILGSMHFVPPGQHGWVAPVRRAFEWADQIVVEMKSENAPSLFTMPFELNATALPQELYSKVERDWSLTGLPAIDQCNLPGICLAMAAVSLLRHDGVEPSIRAWADEAGKEVKELEGPNSFLASMADVPLADFVASLGRFFMNRPLAQRRFEAMYRAWRGHSKAKLYSLIVADMPRSVWRGIFEHRNKQWAPTITRLAGEAPIACSCARIFRARLT